MRKVEKLSVKELREIVQAFQDLAYLTPNDDNSDFVLSNEKELDSDTLSELIDILVRYDLNP